MNLTPAIVMRTVLLTTIPIAMLLGACSYSGNEPWRRSVCNSVPHGEERERCMAEATRSQADYERDVEDVLEPAPTPR